MTYPSISNLRKYHFESPIHKIGKTQWRFVVYESMFKGEFSTDYEWLNNGVWYPSNERKGYNLNDGMYNGLPKSLVNLWAIYKHEYVSCSTSKGNKYAR